MEERVKDLEDRLADLEEESRQIRSRLNEPMNPGIDAVQRMLKEMKELLGRLKMIEKQLETLEGP
jgi:phage-related minor tail protein